ncbi:hypothetical protein LCGC14_1773600 [marine sediment metagenome]|uniref:Uncharacterized protein n=1 Tax=marine sediment metagenome TaxID=412755 RepID=A0A0F9JCF3_9ZZZZ
MKKLKISEIRREVSRLQALGKNDEASDLWHQAVSEMLSGKIIDDENLNLSTKGEGG